MTDYRGFLRERLGEKPGDIVDREGTVVGRHTGTYGFTIGQRKGLAVSGPSPLYVTSIDADRNQVTVGAVEDSAVGTIDIEGVTWHARPSADAVDEFLVQIRSNSAPLSARFADPPDPSRARDRDRVTIRLERPATGVAIGQTAVVYAGPMVVMAGTIAATKDGRPLPA